MMFFLSVIFLICILAPKQAAKETRQIWDRMRLGWSEGKQKEPPPKGEG